MLRQSGIILDVVCIVVNGEVGSRDRSAHRHFLDKHSVSLGRTAFMGQKPLGS